MKTGSPRWYLFPSALSFLILASMTLGQNPGQQTPNSSQARQNGSAPKPQTSTTSDKQTSLPISPALVNLKELEAVQSYYLSLHEVQDVQVTENPAETNASSSEQVSGKANEDVNYDIHRDRLSSHSIMLTLPTDKSYTVTFRSIGRLTVDIELLKGAGNQSPVQAIRYRDLILPPGIIGTLKIGPQGMEPLRVKSAEGGAEQIITPTVSLEGQAAQDVDGPRISFSESREGDEVLVSISATDPSGVRSLEYSTDPYNEAGMGFEPYTSTIKVNPKQTPVIYAVAEDNAANESGMVEYRLKEAQ